MSATIGINKSDFVIFGAGHDYTLADSGEGEKIFFSHPYVPLNSVNYAGQYYFRVPDENGEMIDAVKDDIAHCTFTPAIGTAFDTEGEVTVKVEYYREYIYPEETVIVQKELEQVITVVDHGTVVEQAKYMGNVGRYYRRDIYSDGYCFIRPMSTSEFPDYYCLYSWEGKTINKVSSIPWRATGLGNGIYGFGVSGSVDISELAYADTSHVTYMYDVFRNVTSDTWDALSYWDASALTELHNFAPHSNLDDITVMSGWNPSHLTDLSNAFNYMAMESLEGLESWDVSGVTNMSNTFSYCQSLEDISALANWNVSNVTDMSYIFTGDIVLEELYGLEDWDVSKVTNIVSAFSNCYKLLSLEPLTNWNPKPTSLVGVFTNCHALQSLDGIEGFDLSDCTSFANAFFSCTKLTDISALSSWVTSRVTDFGSMFAWDYWIDDISAINEWDFASALNLESMFAQVSAVLTMDGISLDLSNVTNISNMFFTHPFGYLDGVGEVFEENNTYKDYAGNTYSVLGATMTVYPKDASNAENWDVNGTGLGAFDNNWNNRPSWN